MSTIDTSKRAGYDSGVLIDYTKSRRRISVFGWQGIVGLHDTYAWTLRAFLDELGVSDTDLRAVIRDRANDPPRSQEKPGA